MGKFANGVIGITVKVYESKNATIKQTESGGFFQMLGQCSATVTINDEIMFEKLSGMIGINYRNQEAYDNNNGNLFISYTNTYKTDTGKTYDKVIVSEKMNAYLTTETMKSFSEGFAQPEYEEEMAKAAEMSTEDYVALSKQAIARAVSLKAEVHKTSNNIKHAFNELDKELAAEIF